MSKKIILYLPEHWKRTTKKQKEAQAEEDAFKHMMEDAIAQEMAKVEREIMRCKTEDQLQSVMRLSKLLITDD